MGEYAVSRYELGEIMAAHESFMEYPKKKEYAEKQLKKIGATLPMSRHGLATLMDDIERSMS